LKPQKNRARDIGFYMLMMIILLATVFTMTSPDEVASYVYSDIIDLFQQEKVESFTLTGNDLVLTLRDESDGENTVSYKLYNVDWFKDDLGDLIKQQKADGIITSYDLKEGWVAPWWLSFLPYLVFIIILGAFWYYIMAKSGGGAPAWANSERPERASAARREKKSPLPTWRVPTRKRPSSKRSCRS
jgi:cell division protease FtsH